MNASRQTKIRSIVVLIVAAVILELTTAVQYFSSRHVVTEQLSRMAQHDLNNTGETAKLRTGVERALNQIVPDVERLYARGDNDSLREVIRHMVASQTRIVGVDFCRVVGDDDKLSISTDVTTGRSATRSSGSTSPSGRGIRRHSPESISGASPTGRTTR